MVAAFVGLLLIPAGCGGSSSGSDASAPTKAEFIKRADAICEKTDKEQEAILSSYFNKHPNAAISKAVKEDVAELSLPPIRTEADELAALPAPDGHDDDIETFVNAVEEGLQRGEEDPSALVNEGSNGPFAEAKKLGEAYGFKACALPL